MVASQLAFAINDTSVKLASERLGLFQIVVVRGVIVIAGLSVWVGLRRFPSGTLWPLPRSVWVRVGFDVAATVCFLLALFNMDIGDLAAISQFVPLGITLAAAAFLGERVRWPRYLAVIGGFIGVLLIIRPGSSAFTPYAFLALGAVATVIARDLATRGVPRETPSIVVALVTAIATWLLAVICVVGGAEWRPITSQSVSLIGLAATALVGGLVFSVMTIRVGELSFAAPFRYTGVVWAMISQIAVFGVIPDALSVAGATIIVSMGLFAMYRDRKTLRDIAASPVVLPSR